MEFSSPLSCLPSARKPADPPGRLCYCSRRAVEGVVGHGKGDKASQGDGEFDKRGEVWQRKNERPYVVRCICFVVGGGGCASVGCSKVHRFARLAPTVSRVSYVANTVRRCVGYGGIVAPAVQRIPLRRNGRTQIRSRCFEFALSATMKRSVIIRVEVDLI